MSRLHVLTTGLVCLLMTLCCGIGCSDALTDSQTDSFDYSRNQIAGPDFTATGLVIRLQPFEDKRPAEQKLKGPKTVVIVDGEVAELKSESLSRYVTSIVQQEIYSLGLNVSNTGMAQVYDLSGQILDTQMESEWRGLQTPSYLCSWKIQFQLTHAESGDLAMDQTEIYKIRVFPTNDSMSTLTNIYINRVLPAAINHLFFQIHKNMIKIEYEQDQGTNGWPELRDGPPMPQRL